MPADATAQDEVLVQFAAGQRVGVGIVLLGESVVEPEEPAALLPVLLDLEDDRAEIAVLGPADLDTDFVAKGVTGVGVETQVARRSRPRPES